MLRQAGFDPDDEASLPPPMKLALAAYRQPTGEAAGRGADEAALQRENRRLRRKLERSQALLEELAAALGMCGRCGGARPACSRCAGEGSPGSGKIDRELFWRYVVPVLVQLGIVEPAPQRDVPGKTG
jgi:hypothetical protein